MTTTLRASPSCALEIGRLRRPSLQSGFSPALAARLKDDEAALAGLERIRDRRRYAPAGGDPARVLALADNLQRRSSWRRRARGTSCARRGPIALQKDAGLVYAEFDNAADNLLMAVGGVSMGRVAGAGFEPATFGL